VCLTLIDEAVLIRPGHVHGGRNLKRRRLPEERAGVQEAAGAMIYDFISDHMMELQRPRSDPIPHSTNQLQGTPTDPINETS
jgi:hypothetical protein